VLDIVQLIYMVQTSRLHKSENIRVKLLCHDLSGVVLASGWCGERGCVLAYAACSETTPVRARAGPGRLSAVSRLLGNMSRSSWKKTDLSDARIRGISGVVLEMPEQEVQFVT
jgi:hypothetical protein